MPAAVRSLALMALLPRFLPQVLAHGRDDPQWNCTGLEGDAAPEVWFNDEFQYSKVEEIILMVCVSMALVFDTILHKFQHHAEHSYRFGDLRRAITRRASRDLRDAFSQRHTRLQQDLVNRMGGEFMVLGFLAFCMFMFNNCGGCRLLHATFPPTQAHIPRSADDWFHTLEEVHIDLFVGMILYFILMSRVVHVSMRKLRKWERLHLRPGGSAILQEEVHESAYPLWRVYFVEGVLHWRQTRPELFARLLQHLGLDADDSHATELCRSYIERHFTFCIYLALHVERGVHDAITVSNVSWLMVLAGLVVLWILCRYLEVGMWPFSLFSAALATLMLVGMKLVVRRQLRAIKIQGRRQAKEAAAAAEGAEGEVEETTCPEAAGRPQVGMLELFSRRHHTEIAAFRVLQVFVASVTYNLARWLVDMEWWSADAGRVLQRTSLFIVLYLMLFAVLPREVPKFLVVMALPPMMDNGNVNLFFDCLPEAANLEDA